MAESSPPAPSTHRYKGLVYVRPLDRGVTLSLAGQYLDAWVEQRVGGPYRYAWVTLTLEVHDSWDQSERREAPAP